MKFYIITFLRFARKIIKFRYIINWKLKIYQYKYKITQQESKYHVPKENDYEKIE